MRIASWNVNSVRTRLERLVAWLDRHSPDVLCLQELKATDEAFPFDVLSAAGYHAAVHGQKTYNGVALLSRSQPADIRRGLDDDTDDPQARLISAEINGIRIISAYVPNGGEIGSDKFAYKLDWLKRLRTALDRQFTPDQPLVLCGDFNVAIDDADVANPGQWADSVLCVAEVRDALDEVTDWGLVDIFRKKHPDGGIYSWWDYRQLGFQKNDGLRIDHIFATESVAARCRAAVIDRDERKGSKPSDHAPIMADFD